MLRPGREEYYLWEVAISFRKLLLVCGTKLSSGFVLAGVLWNLFVTIAATIAQVKCSPFANDDANLAEICMLLSQLMVLILALGQLHFSTDSSSNDGAPNDTDDVVRVFNNAMCLLRGIHVP